MRAFLSDLWSHRGFRFTLIAGLSIAAFVTCFYWALNWSGEKRWQRVKAKLEAEGESFDFYSLYPAPIPDEHNFCAIEPLNGIRTPEGTSPEAVAAQKKRDEIKRCVSFLVVPSAYSLGGISTELADWGRLFDMFSGENFDSEKRLTQIYSVRGFDVGGESKSWENVRRAVDRQAPIIGQMAAVVEQRLHADFLPRQTREGLPKSLFKLPVPHLNSVQDLSDLIRFHGMAAIQAHEGQPALRDTQSLLRIAEGADFTTTLIGNVVGVAIRARAMQLTWKLTESRLLQEAELKKLQDEWERCDILSALIRAIRSEMLMQLNAISAIENNPYERWSVLTPTSGPPITSPRFVALYKMIPLGMVIHSKAAMLEFQYRNILSKLKTNGLRGCIENMKQMNALLSEQDGWPHFDMIVMRSFGDPYSSISCMAAYAENQRLQAILACALERHFLRHGSYPAMLQSLDVEFRAGNDLLDVNGEMMHYIVVPSGRFRLWSPGPDGKNDGGKFSNEITTRAYKPRSPHQHNYIGDWVWRYDPAVKVP